MPKSTTLVTKETNYNHSKIQNIAPPEMLHVFIFFIYHHNYGTDIKILTIDIIYIFVCP